MLCVVVPNKPSALLCMQRLVEIIIVMIIITGKYRGCSTTSSPYEYVNFASHHPGMENQS